MPGAFARFRSRLVSRQEKVRGRFERTLHRPLERRLHWREFGRWLNQRRHRRHGGWIGCSRNRLRLGWRRLRDANVAIIGVGRISVGGIVDIRRVRRRHFKRDHVEHRFVMGVGGFGRDVRHSGTAPAASSDGAELFVAASGSCVATGGGAVATAAAGVSSAGAAQGERDRFFNDRRLGCAAVVKRPDPLLDQIECRAQSGPAVRRGDLSATGFDGADLGIDQVANPAVGADFPQPPCDFPDDPGALADRRQLFLQREAVERRRRGGSGLVDRAA